jgi:predicted O-methyltransferase YrrM
MDIRYWTAAGASLARLIRRSPSEFARSVLTMGTSAAIEPRGRAEHLFTAFPEAEGFEIDMGRVIYRRSNLDPYEQFALAAITGLRRPQRIFEIGTYDGATTSLLARSAPQAEVFTLDLPPQGAGVATEAAEAAHAEIGGIGSRFRDTPEAQRITQLFGDSRTFDASRWYGTVDVVLIDGGHEYEVAKADTATALKLVAPGGVIVWDDYMILWPGVVRAVDESGVPVFRLAATDFAVYENTSSASISGPPTVARY